MARQQAAVAEYDAMRYQLTRLRLLASSRIRDGAVDLLKAQRTLNSAEPADVATALGAASAARRHLVDLAKKEMGLG
jgi:hypothetical protein